MKKPTVEIWYELETRCNLHCKFCFNFWKDGLSGAPRRLNTEHTLNCLRILFEAVNCEKISISGGEPLLREDLYDILAFVKEHGVPMVLTTNGTLLDECTISRLVEAGIKSFQVPFHSIEPDMHDLLSGGKCWHQTLQAFIALKESGTNVIAVFVATKLNLGGFDSVLDVLSLLGIDEIIFNRFIPSGLGSKYREYIGVPDDEELVSVLVKANERANDLDLTIHLGTPIELPLDLIPRLDRITPASCPVGYGQSRWTVDAEGNIRRCNHSATSIGNLLNGGAALLLKEIEAASCGCQTESQIHPCQFIRTDQLIQLNIPTILSNPAPSDNTKPADRR